MSLKFFKNREREIHEYHDIADLFNPRINKFWVDPGLRHNFTVSDYFAAIKQLYTLENIHAQPTLINYLRHSVPASYFREYVDKITALIPDGKYWILNFMSYESHYNEGNRHGWFIMKPQARITVDPVTFTCRFEETISTISGTNEGTAVERLATLKDAYAAELNPMIQRLETLFEAHARKHLNPSNYVSNNPFVQRLLMMARGDEYATGNNAAYTAQALADLGENVALRVATTTSYESVSVKVTVPITKNNKASICTLFQYSANPLDHLPYPLKFKNEHNPVLYGVELEVSTDYNVRQIIEATDEPYMIAKSDGSISGNKRNAMELVTIPMSFKAHKREWAKWFSKLDYDKFDTSKDTNNGMHVHIGRTHFDNEQHIRNLAWLLNNPANYEFMLLLSERTSHSMMNYAPTRNYGESATKGRAIKSLMSDIRQLRGACNIGSNKPTVEIRLFRGIVSYAAFLKNLECVDAMFNFSRELPVHKMNVRSFVTWLNAQPYNKYPVFKKFVMSMKHLDMMMAGNDMFEVIFTTKDPEKILAKMNKAKIPITNEHVTILNKRMKKRAFLFDKKTNSLVLNYTNRFAFHHMDRDLEKRYVNL